MAGFSKIDISEAGPKKTQEPEKTSPFMSIKRKKKRKFPTKIVVIVVLIVVLLGVSIGVPAFATYKAGMKTYAQAKVFAQAMKQQNIDLASEELDKTKVDLAETRTNFDRMFLLKFVPVANFYYNDADHMLRAGDHGLTSARIVIDSIKPYSDVLGLKGSGSFSSGSAEDRIKTAVMTMGKITPQIDKIADSLVQIQKEVDDVNPDHYPTFLFGPKPKATLTQLRSLTDQGVDLVDQARPLIKVLPSLLGESEQKKYLVLFQNDKELRPTGGFITAYSVMAVDKGHLSVDRSDDIYPLDDSISGKPAAPDALVKYLEVNRLNLRDSNLSPDYIASMKTFQSLYNKASGRVTDINGIIAIDTNVLISTIKILDDQVNAGGLTFTTKTDARCDCPEALYTLESDISTPVNYIKSDRKHLISDLLSAIMTKALSSSPKIYWGPLFQSMLMLTNQKHIQFYLFDKDAQSGIEAMNAAGRIKTFEGDYLHINDANLGGQKSNLFTKEAVDVSYDVTSDGTINKTLTIKYKNAFPPSNCDLEAVAALCLNATLRDWFRIYVPKGSQIVSSTGSQVKMKTYEDLGKTVFEGFLTVRPLGESKFVITYTLPFKLSSGSPLPVLIQKQGGTDGIPYSVSGKGKTIEDFQLYADKEMKIKF
jgi:hypothetical protein